MPVMYCTHVESDVRIDFPTPSRVGRMPTSQATSECLHSLVLRSRRTSQLTRACDAPYSCEYSARVATQHTQLRYKSAGEHTIAISIRHSTHHATNSSRRHERSQNTSATCVHTMPSTIRAPAHATATHSTYVTLLARDRRHARFSLNTHLPLVADVALCCQRCAVHTQKVACESILQRRVESVECPAHFTSHQRVFVLTLAPITSAVAIVTCTRCTILV